MEVTPVHVLTCDQVRSRRGPDLVPAAQDALLSATAPLLPPERTAGDEIQTVYEGARDVVLAVETLTRLGGWRIGIGVGEAETPLPAGTREARGPAFVAARDAVEAARTTAMQVALRTPEEAATRGTRTVGGEDYGDLRPVDAAEHALTLLVATLTRRTDAGWEIVDLIDDGLNGRQAAERLGISESAVSQRLSRAAHEEGRRARALATFLLDRVGGDA